MQRSVDDHENLFLCFFAVSTNLINITKESLKPWILLYIFKSASNKNILLRSFIVVGVDFLSYFLSFILLKSKIYYIFYYDLFYH
jgi:hypothetical protein